MAGEGARFSPCSLRLLNINSLAMDLLCMKPYICVMLNVYIGGG